MNRLQYFLRAKTLYGLHSPFVYRLYTEVLFARVDDRKGWCVGRYEEFVWRLETYYGVKATREEHRARLVCRDGEFLVLDHPHRREADWQRVKETSHWHVTLDFYSVAIAVSNPRLSRQHFLLR